MSANNTLPLENVRQIEAPTDISFYLTGIEMGARSVVRNVRHLPFRHGFETLAEDELKQAFDVLASALDQIITAQKEYQSKPVEP